MDWLLERTGLGYVLPHPGTNRPIYHWTVTSLSAAMILVQTEPFMIEKKERAIQALASFGSAVDLSNVESLFSLFEPATLGGS